LEELGASSSRIDAASQNMYPDRQNLMLQGKEAFLFWEKSFYPENRGGSFLPDDEPPPRLCSL
jgi:hypothetical protein